MAKEIPSESSGSQANMQEVYVEEEECKSSHGDSRQAEGCKSEPPESEVKVDALYTQSLSSAKSTFEDECEVRLKYNGKERKILLLGSKCIRDIKIEYLPKALKTETVEIQDEKGRAIEDNFTVAHLVRSRGAALELEFVVQDDW